MDIIGAVLLVLAVTLVVALFVSQPFLGRGRKMSFDESSRQQEREHQRSALMAERDRVLNALHELDFDFAMGKVPQEDYPDQRAVLLQRGADVLRRLDEIGGESAVEMGEQVPVRPDGSVEERIEAAVAARRADSARGGRPAPEAVAKAAGNGSGAGRDELEDLIASRKRQRQESSAGFCPRCGKPVQKSDKFCSKCGATL